MNKNLVYSFSLLLFLSTFGNLFANSLEFPKDQWQTKTPDELKINQDKIELVKKEWKIDKYTIHNNIKIKNFYGGKKLNWKIRH